LTKEKQTVSLFIHFAPLYLIFLAELSKPAFQVSQILLKNKNTEPV